MKRIVLSLFAIVVFVACSSSRTATLSPGVQPPTSQEVIAVAFPEASEKKISDEAVQILETTLQGCGKTIIPANQYESAIQKKGLSTPRRVTAEFVKKLNGTINAKYLITLEVTKWVSGGFGKPDNTEIRGTITVWDITSGNTVLLVEAHKRGGTGIFSKNADDLAKAEFKDALNEWKGFCQ